ncbi:MAG: hypothetical protein ACPG4U_14810 [Pseudomonadales bacterium]
MSFFRRKLKRDSGLVCLHETARGLSLAYTDSADSGGQLKHCHFFAAQALKDEPALLPNYLAKHQLQGADCSVVLAPGEYQMLLVDAPDVAPEEMRDALWWRVKDLVGVDIDNAQIDYLDLPTDSFKNQAKKVYAIVADKRKLAQRINYVQELGLEVRAVEVPETALLHLLGGLCEPAIGTALLYLEPQQSLLSLMSQGQMYLSRALQYNYEERAESVVLDLQRSMDYYESQIGKAPCLKVIALPLQREDAAIMQSLHDNIGVEVVSADLNSYIKSPIELSVMHQQQCFIAIAGSVRKDLKVAS